MKKSAYFYEIPLFFVLLEAVNRGFFPSLPGFEGVEPHPYWLAVLLFAFRYGVAAGFFAGVAAAAVFLGLRWQYGERYVFEDAAFYTQPILFIVVGAVVGVAVKRYRDAVSDGARRYGVLKEKHTALSRELETSRTVVRELEKKIVTRMATLISLYEGARRMDATDAEILLPAILDFAAKTLQADEAALYVKEGQKFVLKSNWGWGEGAPWPRSFPPGEGLCGRAAAGRIATVRERLIESGGDFSGAAAGEGLMAGPLRSGESGEVAGVLCVQRMPLLQFNSAAVNLFSFLLQWASRAIGRSRDYTRLKELEIIDGEYEVYSKRYFMARLDEEFQRSKTYYLPLGVGVARLKAADGLPAERERTLWRALARMLRETLRGTDVVARYGDGDAPFAFLLVTASPAQAAALKSRVEAAYASLGLGHFASLSVGTANFTPRTVSGAELLEAARKDGDGA